jgi:hypothetical protein
MESNLSVPKLEVRVSLTSTFETVEGFVFVSEFSEHTLGAERVGEILNHLDSFLPLRDLRDERVYLYNKSSIVLVTVLEADRRDWEIQELQLSPAERLEITLVDGERLSGLVYLDPRREKSRVSDLLNRPDRFFPVVRDDGVTYVSKRHILRIV